MEHRFTTTHQVFFKTSTSLPERKEESIDLVVTSPPYPMIAMWDDQFCSIDPSIRDALSRDDGMRSFELMHLQLDAVWDECARLLKPGGFACINIGDATRTLGKQFRLYPNHSRIIEKFLKLRFTVLPLILWRKQTNAPNKFMGSGMLPAGAYVTLEHEYILVFRKGEKRTFTSEKEKLLRQQSAFFWEERNRWFSDVWDFKGTLQEFETASRNSPRKRTGAFPFELAYRLINMYSLYNDTVYDPFLGTGTTLAASIVSGRNCVGVELMEEFEPVIDDTVSRFYNKANLIITSRLERHCRFIRERQLAGKKINHTNEIYRFPVVTGQEKSALFPYVETISKTGKGTYTATHFVASERGYAEGIELFGFT